MFSEIHNCDVSKAKTNLANLNQLILCNSFNTNQNCNAKCFIDLAQSFKPTRFNPSTWPHIYIYCTQTSYHPLIQHKSTPSTHHRHLPILQTYRQYWIIEIVDIWLGADILGTETPSREPSAPRAVINPWQLRYGTKLHTAIAKHCSWYRRIDTDRQIKKKDEWQYKSYSKLTNKQQR